MHITPIDDWVLLKLDDTKMTPGGIALPDKAMKLDYQVATVLAVGEGHRDLSGNVMPMRIKDGDRVLTVREAMNFVNPQRQDIAMVRESDIFGVVNRG